MDKCDQEMTRGALTAGCRMWAPILRPLEEAKHVESREGITVTLEPGVKYLTIPGHKPHTTRLKRA